MSSLRLPSSGSIQIPRTSRQPARRSPTTGVPPPALTSGVIRVGVTKEIVPLLQEFGVDPDRVFRQAGLDRRLFDDENNLIPYAALGHLLTYCVAYTRCQHFGLLIGQRGSLSAIGPIGGLLQHSPTVGRALSSLVEHLHLHDRGAAPTLTTSEEVAMLGYAIYLPGVESTDQISDGAIAIAMNIMRALCGADWAPDEVLLSRHAVSDVEPYRRFFRAPVRFDQETAALVFPMRWLGHHIAGADPVFRQVFEACVQDLEAAMENDWKENLRRLLRTAILTNRCSADMVAQHLAVHRRTLGRHLHAGGTGFQRLVDEARFEIARQLLVHTKVPLGQIAVALGYSEASAFTRAFRRWSGQAPAAWRAEQRPSRTGPSLDILPRTNSAQEHADGKCQ